MDNNPDEKLELKPAETHKECWIGVFYYGGKIPFAIIYENREIAASSRCDIVYKIEIPYKE